MFNFNKWYKIYKTSPNGKVYATHVCLKCKKETLTPTKYCAHCGKRMIRDKKHKLG